MITAMEIKVVLFGMLRERLAKESRGRLAMELPEAATIRDLLAKLGIQMTVICSVNGETERNFDHPLKDGDGVQIFQSIGGG